MTARVRVAVLGAGGRIGSELLRHLSRSERFNAVGIARNAVGAGPLRWKGLEVRCGSVDEPGSAEQLLGDRDVVVNCAHDTGWPGTARVRNLRLAKISRGVSSVKVLVQLSSVAVYGACIVAGRGSFSGPRPSTHYGREKLVLERSLLGERRSDKRTVIVRLGHVYGPYQWLSRSIFDLLEAPGARLPFDGQLASNAVHVKAVCHAIEDLLIADPSTGTVDLVEDPQRTWRELFDVHARVSGADPIQAMDADRSERIRAAVRAEQDHVLGVQLARELAAWAASLPFSFVSSSPAARDLATRWLAAMRWVSAEQRLTMLYSRARARRALSKGPTEATDVPAWLLSDPAPGPGLPTTRWTLSDDDLSELAAWHASYSGLTWSPRSPSDTGR